MTEAFLKIVNMSISAGWLVLAVLVLRFVLKKAPKWVSVLLWGIVAVRLICPFSIESALSLIPSAEVVSPSVLIESPVIDTGFQVVDEVVNPMIQQSVTMVSPEKGINTMKLVVQICSNIWIVGLTLMLGYTAITYLRLRRKLSMATLLRENIFQCETVRSPFVLGILKPRIYLPYGMDGNDLHHVVAHEQAHIRRKDHWWKPLGFLLLTVYWFNPLMWVAYILLCRDIELACDEKVIAQLGNEQRADYTQALVACSVNRRMIAACPLAFGEVGVKERVRSVMNYRKPGFWLILIAVILCIVLAVSMLTDPVHKTTPAEIFSTLEPDDIQWTQATIWDIPAGDHIMLDEDQISELVSILQSLESRDFKEGITPDRKVSVMLNCGDMEILLLVSEDMVQFSFDTETAQRVTDVNWCTNDEALRNFVNQIAKYSLTTSVIEWINNEDITEQQIGEAELKTPEFPGVLFHWDGYNITADGETLIQGMPIVNAYLTDLNGDKKPEICATVSFGSGMIDTHVVVYDYANRQEYTLWERGLFEYALRLENGVLLCDTYSYNSESDEPRMTGRLEIHEEAGLTIRILSENSDPSIWITTIEDRTVTEGIATDEAIEPFFEDESYIYSFPSIKSHLVMVHYSDGRSENVKTALENGRVSMEKLDQYGVDYYAEPKFSMEPTEVNLRGFYGGYLFTNFNGATYRYSLTEKSTELVTADNLLLTFAEENRNWEVYSLKEYPDGSKVLAISGTNSAWLCEYAPAQRAEEGALEAARAAGYVIEEDCILTDGQDAWHEFYEKTQRGEQASIHVAHYLTLDPDRTVATTYEAYKQDYPSLFIDELTYDGEKFILRTADDVRTYEYLMRYDISGTPLAGNTEHKQVIRYVLTHDPSHTYEELFASLVSSALDAVIPHYTICTEQIT